MWKNRSGVLICQVISQTQSAWYIIAYAGFQQGGARRSVNVSVAPASNQPSMTVPDSASDVSDAMLVSSFRAGDERAATELVRRHAGPLGRFLYASGAPEADLEDLVQETFLKAFRALDGWRGDASFRSWLFRIGGNLRKDWFRRDRGKVVVSLLDTDLTDRADPAGEAEAREAGERIREGIAKLPRLQREVFLMRTQQAMDYQEIAAALDTTSGAARVHYHHAVKRLKELIA